MGVEAQAGRQHSSEAGLGQGEAGLRRLSRGLYNSAESGPRVRLKVSCGGAYRFLILVL